MGKIACAQELKGLQVQLAKEQASCKTLKDESVIAQGKHSQAQAAVKSLEARIVTLQYEAPAPIVSEHALLRYLERVKGVDLKALSDEILGDGTASAISFAKSGRIQKGDITLIIKNNVVVTVA